MLAAIRLVFALLALSTRRHRQSHATPDDTRLELFMVLALLALLVQPLIFAITGKLCGWLMPESRGAWAQWPWWVTT